MGENIEQVPTIGISLNLELPGKKTLVLQSLVERDGNNLDAVLDKIRTAADRQFSHCLLDDLQRQLENEKKIAADHGKRMAIVEDNHNRRWLASNRKGPMRLSESEEKERQQAIAQAEESKRRIAQVEGWIKEHRAKAGLEA
jgi:hypothetical protein